MKLKLGLPKGSLQEATFALFGRRAINPSLQPGPINRWSTMKTIEPILLRPQEIPIYVEKGSSTLA